MRTRCVYTGRSPTPKPPNIYSDCHTSLSHSRERRFFIFAGAAMIYQKEKKSVRRTPAQSGARHFFMFSK